MKKQSFFFKIFFGYFFIIILIFFLLFFLSFGIINDNYIKTLSKNLKNINKILEMKILPLIEKNSVNDIDRLVKKNGKEIKVRITVITTNGVILGDSEKDPKKMENHKLRPEIKKALKGIIGSSIRFSRTVRAEMLYVASPIKLNNKVVGIIRTSLYLKDINKLLYGLKIKILQVAIIAIIISLFGSIFFARNLSHPIKELVGFASRVGDGDFDTKILSNRKDEIKDLAESFNYMTSKIKKLFAELTAEKEELNSIIYSIKEGLVVIDKQGKIIIANDQFTKIANSRDILGQVYWEILRNNELDSLIKEVIKKRTNLNNVIKIRNRDYLCSFSPLSVNSVIIIFYDITEKKEIEKIKKDFVSNVSHELKTPLTAIKGFVENLLLLEKNKDKKHYLEIVSKNTERLINIVNDLMVLSELEKNRDFINKEKVDIVKVIKSVLTIFEKKIKEKNLYIKIDLNGNIPLIEGDSYKIEEMFINLIDNGIKYTEKGGITISIKKEGEFLKIFVQDTGIGIPNKDIPRIFERFYVVDKSRSRKLGGTGLGLSIVKHIVMNHNGKIEVESEVNKGTTFIISIPV